MVNKYSIFQPHISKRLNKFFNDNDKAISLFFSILKRIKPNIIDAYTYSINNPPPNPRYKYTDKLYIGCIIYITKYNHSWESFIGPIPGKQVHKRHMEYLKEDLYTKFFNKSLNKYLRDDNNHLHNQYLCADTTIINNKQCTEINKHLPINKNRKGLKISSINNSQGIPLILSIKESSVHDSKCIIDDLDKLENNKFITDATDQCIGHTYILADSGYDIKSIRDRIEQLKKNILLPSIIEIPHCASKMHNGY
jgi:hypothetical protein